MTKQDIFEAWAPASAFWSRWAKPVLFSQLDAIAPGEPPGVDSSVEASWAPSSDRETAMVVDLPGCQGANVALSLAAKGYRPVPLYNACPGSADAQCLVNVRPIMAALASAAPALQQVGLPDAAPPAFLLDAQRNMAVLAPAPGMFDNRSISLPTDFPSANLIVSLGLRRVVLVQTRHVEPQADLSHTLRRWQDAGLTVVALATDEPGAPRPITITRPRSYKRAWYNLLAKLGLIANPLGGFGGELPMPSNG